MFALRSQDGEKEWDLVSYRTGVCCPTQVSYSLCPLVTPITVPASGSSELCSLQEGRWAKKGPCQNGLGRPAPESPLRCRLCKPGFKFLL
jgi:hypothetical protein